MYPTEKIVSDRVARRNAAGVAHPPPFTETGTLNSIAVSGAAPVTMQKSTDGSPSAPSWSRPWCSEGEVVVTDCVAVMAPPGTSG